MFWILALTCSLLLADTPVKGVDAADLKKFQGKWSTTSVENGGKKSSAKEIAQLSLEVTTTRLVTREGIDIKEEAAISLLNPKAKPAEIDLKITAGVDLDKVLKGIYKFDGDTLTICVAEPGKDRPSTFASKEGSGHTLFVFRKVK